MTAAKKPTIEERRARHRERYGYEVVERAGGRSHLVWEPPHDFENPMGLVHGGAVAVIIDDTAGMAVGSTLKERRALPTASLRIDFLKGIRPGVRYDCRGKVVRAGKRLAISDAEIFSPDGELMVRGTATYAIDPADQPL